MNRIQNFTVAVLMAATVITPIFADAKGGLDISGTGSKKLEAPKTQDTKNKDGAVTKTKTKPSKNKNNGNISYNPMEGNESWGKNKYGAWQKVRQWEEKPYVAKDVLDFYNWTTWETNYNYNIKKEKIIVTNTKSNVLEFIAPRDGYYNVTAIEHRISYFKKKKNTTYKRLKTSTSYLGKIQSWEYKTESTYLDAGTKKYTKKPEIWNLYLKKGKNKIDGKITKKVEEIEVQHRLIK